MSDSSIFSLDEKLSSKINFLSLFVTKTKTLNLLVVWLGEKKFSNTKIYTFEIKYKEEIIFPCISYYIHEIYELKK